MTVAEYNAFCRSLAHTTHVVQWGGAHVWKVSGKVFAIARRNEDDDQLYVTFKCSPMSYDMLKEMPGCRPAPYLASRGMKWIQRTGTETMDDSALRDYLRESHRLVVLGLPKRTQLQLGFTSAPTPSKTSKPKLKSGAKKSMRHGPRQGAER